MGRSATAAQRVIIVSLPAESNDALLIQRQHHFFEPGLVSVQVQKHKLTLRLRMLQIGVDDLETVRVCRTSQDVNITIVEGYSG